MRIAFLSVSAADEMIEDSLLSKLQEYMQPVFVALSSSIPDQRNLIAETIRRWCDEESVDILLTVGGVSIIPGTSSQESVPLAMSDVVEREVPGMAETMRAFAREEFPLAVLENVQAGIRGRTLIVNLPRNGDVALAFLEAVAALFEGIVHQLQADRMSESEDIADSQHTTGSLAEGHTDLQRGQPGLSGQEFAAFRARRRSNSA